MDDLLAMTAELAFDCEGVFFFIVLLTYVAVVVAAVAGLREFPMLV